MRIALICGGPSLERGISLNSARSVLDHLEGDGIEIVPIYFDHKRQAYLISTAQLYSNTPSDFDFKLQQTAKVLSRTGLKETLKSVDIAFPVMHGKFGEDGQIQRLLEKYKVPYVGSEPKACRRCFDKFDANEYIRQHGFFTLPSAVLKIYHEDHKDILNKFFNENKVERAIVKPATGGSSIGVFSVGSPEEALEKVEFLFSKRIDTRVVIEPFCEGIEFTVIVLQNQFDMPVAILPTEIETDYQNHQIFDYRRKYLPSNQVRYHCPPRFSNETIEQIQVQAEQLFKVLGMRDFARFDGWLMPDGKLWFSDFNPISGMEQNSFLFQQTARIGMSHRDLIRHVVAHAGPRYGLDMPEEKPAPENRKRVNVLFGGTTSERQVSLMSGTNAWLKLRRSSLLEPHPYFLDLDENVWELPYALTLNHTVEEIMDNCLHAKEDEARLHSLINKVRWRLSLKESSFSEPFFLPRKMSLQDFIEESDAVFIGLHGGIGEDGRLQFMLDKAGVTYNGSGPEASSLCMDKYQTGEVVMAMNEEGISTAPKRRIEIDKVDITWSELQKELDSKTMIVKPQDEGCSSGIVRLFTEEDFLQYLQLARGGAPYIPKGTFSNQKEMVEMPPRRMSAILVEKFVETDQIKVVGNDLKWKKRTAWVEVTVAVLEKEGLYHALSPSLTVADGEVLSVEEKFQGGTGINMTPPPPSIVSPQALTKVKRSMEKVAEAVGIRGYCRIDTFMHVESGEVIVIEVNTTPALTPSTVLYHQALAEPESIWPTQLLEKIATR